MERPRNATCSWARCRSLGAPAERHLLRPDRDTRSLRICCYRPAVPGGIHHAVVVVRDLDTSLRFYRDGLGLDVLLDREVEGDWPGLFDGPSRILRAVFLGDANVP